MGVVQTWGAYTVRTEDLLRLLIGKQSWYHDSKSLNWSLLQAAIAINWMAAKTPMSPKLKKGQDTPRKGRADVYIINFVYSYNIIIYIPFSI